MHLWARFQIDKMAEQFELVFIKFFDKTINHLFVCENVFKIHIIVDNLILYSMMLNVDVFNSFMMLRVFNEDDNVLIVVEDNDRL